MMYGSEKFEQNWKITTSPSSSKHKFEVTVFFGSFGACIHMQKWGSFSLLRNDLRVAAIRRLKKHGLLLKPLFRNTVNPFLLWDFDKVTLFFIFVGALPWGHFPGWPFGWTLLVNNCSLTLFIQSMGLLFTPFLPSTSFWKKERWWYK